MSLYRVSCIMVSRKDESKTLPVSVTEKHPDLAKVSIERKYPNYQMTQIKIEDITVTTGSWIMKKNSLPVKTNRHKTLNALDLDSTWRRELAK